jgi:hypothetical protein
VARCRWYNDRVSEIGSPGHMPHSGRQVPATCQLSAGQLYILEHETTKYTPNDLLLLFIKDLLVMGNQYFWFWASKI